jgi:N6-L-threonylcarbamoyladenine synthase
MCKEREASFFCPERPLLVDNGAMIAFLGEIMFKSGITEKPEQADFNARERTDQIEVTWR